jgi:L-ascorbate metabolism protein UlaG (beta-lactamase superfamily)
VNVITDPIYSDHAGIPWVGPGRVRPPGIAFAKLPKIDAVLVSHSHPDHMDLPTLLMLSERDAPRVFVGLGNREWLAAAGVKNVSELDWWQEAPLLGGVTLRSVPVQHFSRRALDDGMRTLWTGYVIAGNEDRVYFAGDTGYAGHFAEARKRYGPFRAALLPIGAYLPRWFMQQQHIGPKEAIDAALDLHATTSIAMHFDTFNLADESYLEAPRDLLHEMRVRHARGLPTPHFVIPQPGAAIVLD